MGLKLGASNRTKWEPPDGCHVGRCVTVVDLGTQITRYGDRSQLYVAWELPEVLHVFRKDRGQEPAVVGRTFTASLHEQSALRPFLEEWRGREFTEDELELFDVSRLLGAYGEVEIGSKVFEGKRFTQVEAVRPSKQKPAPVGPLRKFSFDEPREQDFAALPEWMQRKIRLSEEYRRWRPAEAAESVDGQEAPEGGEGDDLDDIPF